MVTRPDEDRTERPPLRERFRLTVFEVYVALLDLAWHQLEQEDTTALASFLSSDEGDAVWWNSCTYASRFQVTFANGDPRWTDRLGGLDCDTQLTFAESRRAAVAMLKAHNDIRPTETWWLVEYLADDPAAWGDWLKSVQSTKPGSPE